MTVEFEKGSVEQVEGQEPSANCVEVQDTRHLSVETSDRVSLRRGRYIFEHLPLATNHVWSSVPSKNLEVDGIQRNFHVGAENKIRVGSSWP